MKTIGNDSLFSFLGPSAKIASVTNTDVRRSGGYRVKSYLELATRVAELQFRNRDYILLFRGQPRDHKNTKGSSTLKPTLFRPVVAGNPSRNTLITRFDRLRMAEELLVDLYEREKWAGIDRLKKYRVLRWSILQHYEVCTTPLLDVTQSLRIAASFASQSRVANAYIQVVGIPNISGAITASAESGLQIIRLASVCPAVALRPHIQEGYLLGEYPEMTAFRQKELYAHYEIDFGRRLIAKFVFRPATFWRNKTFPKVRKNALYPNPGQDPLFKLALKVKRRLEG